MKQPLAYRMRPKQLDDIIGQQHLTDKGSILRCCVERRQLYSMIFYGPPGTGKTTLATVLANELALPYRLFNAVTGNKKDLDIIFEEANYHNGLIVIIDEVHRLNKDKQDLLLPYLENGTIILLGATTSNPFYAINPAIRSRCHLFEVKRATHHDIEIALCRAIQDERGFDSRINVEDAALHAIAKQSNGDIRYALNILEIAALASNGSIDLECLSNYTQIPNMGYSQNGDGYYDVLSSFQKAIRGSDVDAALYYLAMLIEANDMDSIERRLLVTAYEDIGLANPAAVARCVQAIDAAKRIGFPEGRIPLAVAIIDLTLSPKSKSAEAAIDKALKAIHCGAYPIPDYLRYTPVSMKEQDKYDYERQDLWNHIQYLPDQLKDQKFYTPSSQSSYENVLAQNLQKLRSNKRTNKLAELKNKR